MSEDYISHCKTCGLTVDSGSGDLVEMRHELFCLLHLSDHPGHEINLIPYERWYDDWRLMQREPPKRLYSKKDGFVVQIPHWVIEIMETGWLKEADECGCEDAVSSFVKSYQAVLLHELKNDYLARIKKTQEGD